MILFKEQGSELGLETCCDGKRRMQCFYSWRTGVGHTNRTAALSQTHTGCALFEPMGSFESDWEIPQHHVTHTHTHRQPLLYLITIEPPHRHTQTSKLTQIYNFTIYPRTLPSFKTAWRNHKSQSKEAFMSNYTHETITWSTYGCSYAARWGDWKRWI